MIAKALCGIAAAVSTMVVQAAPVWVDWTSMNTVADAASGTLGFTSAFLNADDISDGTINGAFTGFSSAAFSPPTAASDALILVSRTLSFGNVVTFGEAVLDPIIHLHSLASDLTFFDANGGAVAVTRLSGDAGLTVSGNHATGVAYGSTDSNGTIQLNGTFTSFRFYAFFGGREEFYFQVGATQIAAPPPPPPPPPDPNPVPAPSSITLAALALVCARRKASRHRDACLLKP